MTQTAAILEDPIRWIGLLIAVAGAISANPDAAAHTWTSFRSWIMRVTDKTRGFVAKYIPRLRRNIEVQVHSAIGASAMGNIEVTGRAIVGWGENSTVDEKLQILDVRTRALEKEVGELQQSLRNVETTLRAAISDAVADLRQEISEIRHAVDALRSEIVHSDARALPIIVAGLVLTGLSPDAGSVPLWLAWLVLLAVVVFAATLGWRIWRDWTHGKRERAIGR